MDLVIMILKIHCTTTAFIYNIQVYYVERELCAPTGDTEYSEKHNVHGIPIHQN